MDHLRKLRSVSGRRSSGAYSEPLIRSISVEERHKDKACNTVNSSKRPTNRPIEKWVDQVPEQRRVKTFNRLIPVSRPTCRRRGLRHV